jgi:MFS transporter, YNFM family, putative membrane transport protein
MVGGVPAIAIAYLSEEIEPQHAARAAGTYVAGTSIGGLLGRLVAGPVAEWASWRIGIFAVAVLCAVAAALFLALVSLPSCPDRRGSCRAVRVSREQGEGCQVWARRQV